MSIAARNAMLAGGGGWKNPYVTDGLIAMWDGEWNAGPGTHSEGSRSMVDLVTGNSLQLRTEGVTVANNYIEQSCAVAGRANLDSPIYNLGSASHITLECVFSFPQPTPGVRYFTIFSVGKGSNSAGTAIASAEGDDLAVNLSYGTTVSWKNKTGAVSANEKMSASLVRSLANATDFTVYKNNAIQSGWSQGWQGSTVNNYAESEVSILQPQVQNYCVCRWFSTRVYSRALTAAEIAANYAVDKARFNIA